MKGNFYVKPDYIVFVGHGDKKGFIMPELAEDIYEKDEPHKCITAKDIGASNNIQDTCILSTACATGSIEIANEFTKNGNTYIAPSDYVEGSADLLFVTHFFYETITKSTGNKDAYELARNIDSETKFYIFR
jgi:hypothetical protein